jgi:hypothetical protein
VRVASRARIRFGPDELRYITTCDNRAGSVPQAPTVLGGKTGRDAIWRLVPGS